MKISIITVCLNNRDTIGATIDSVLGQSHGDIEYIVIDGGSSDGTLQVVESYGSRIDRLTSGPDSGIYDAMNKGISIATGEVIGILNADDAYTDSEVLADLADRFEDPSLDACYADLVYVHRDNPEKIVRYWKAGEMELKKLYQGWIPPHPAFFIRSEAYRRYGAYLPSFRFSGDYELILRMLLRHRISCAYIPRVLVRMRTGGASNRSVTNIFRANLEAWRAWSINGLSIPFISFLRKPLSKISQYIKRPCC